MGWGDAFTVLACAVTGAAVGVAVVVSGGLLFAPCGIAVFTVVDGATAITGAGLTAMAGAGAAGTALGAGVGNALNQQTSNIKRD